MLPIFNTLQIVDLGKIIVLINITRAIILTITTIIITIAITHGEKSVIFVAEKIIALISIQIIIDRK